MIACFQLYFSCSSFSSLQNVIWKIWRSTKLVWNRWRFDICGSCQWRIAKSSYFFLFLPRKKSFKMLLEIHSKLQVQTGRKYNVSFHQFNGFGKLILQFSVTNVLGSLYHLSEEFLQSPHASNNASWNLKKDYFCFVRIWR